MRFLNKLIIEHEEWLIKRMLFYAEKHQFLKHLKNPNDAFQRSMKELSQSIGIIIEKNKIPELNSDDDYSIDPLYAYGISEAKRQKMFDINLEISLGLFKYYRQSYIDLIINSDLKNKNTEDYRLLINQRKYRLLPPWFSGRPA